PDGQWNKHLLRSASYHVESGLAVSRRRGHVQERQLISQLGVVRMRELYRITRIPQVLEVDTLDNASRVDVQTRDHAHRNGHARRILTHHASLIGGPGSSVRAYP